MNRIATLAASSAMAIAAMAATPAMAAGSAAGTEITNSAVIRYNVNSVSQTALTTSEKITVDRVVRFTVENLSGLAQPVTPGQTGIMTRVRITNQSNAPVSFGPWVYQESGPVQLPAISTLYIDTNGNGLIDTGIDQPLTYTSTDIPVTAPDTYIDWLVPVSVPIEAENFNGQTIKMAYYVMAAEPNSTGNAELPYFNSKYLDLAAAPNTSGVETVLADPAQPEFWFGDPNDGTVLVSATYVVSAALLSVARFSKVISDVVNGTKNPKAIPGATVEYCVAVSNAAGAATATNISIAETLYTKLVFDNTFGIYQNGTVTNGACDTQGAGGGSPGGTFADGKVNGTIASLSAGETKTVRYRATVN